MKTLEEMVGARLAVGLAGPAVSDEELATLRRIRVRNLIAFSRNVVSAEQFRSLVRRLEAALGDRVLVLVDHEGGRIVRFGEGVEGVTRFPDALTVGRTRQPDDVERQGAVEAEELKRLGIRVNLAPCADVLEPSSDPVIGDRAYGSDPTLVAALVAARIRGLQSHGVAACAKHFPGLGAVPSDPHRVLPTIRLSAAQMERHLAPFHAAIEAGVAMIMSSHVCYPSLGDPEGLPATYSHRIIQTLLRGRMGYSGVVVTDDLEMGALRGASGSLGAVAVRAAAAGHDLLLIGSASAAALAAHAALTAAYGRGALPRGDAETSVERIEMLRRRFFSHDSCSP